MKFVVAFSLMIAVAAASFIPGSVEIRYLDFVPEEDLEGRITNGQIAKPKEVPYQAGLELHIGGKSGWCGGSVLSEEWIMTAAHCTDPAEAITVYLGYVNIKNGHDVGQIKIKTSKSNVVIHPKWDPKTITNDISVIKMPNKVKFNGELFVFAFQVF